jgi:uncharacterized protein
MTARPSTIACAMTALLALISIGLPGAARAQAPAPAAQAAPPNPQPTPAAILLAKQIVEIKGVQRIFAPLVRGVVLKTEQMFLQTNFMWQKDLNEVAAIEEKKYAPRVSELVDATARIYAQQFTEQELRQLLAFYQSPIGKKALAVEPKVLDQAMAYAGTWGDNLSQEVIGSMREDMKKRGHDM